MKKIILFFVLLPLISFSQIQNHNFFGIDLNLDWYTLTNYSKATYDLNQGKQYAIVDFKYYHNKINRNFMNLGFHELLLGFPKGVTSDFNEFKPEIFIARIYYIDKNDYNKQSKNDFLKIISLLKEEFGEPETNMIGDKFKAYKWNGVNYQALLNCVEEDLKITFIYLKK